MRDFEVKPELNKILKKLFKKDKKLYEQVFKKIYEIVNSYSVESYKNLKYNLKNYKRVHIGHFVLIFTYDKKIDFLSFEYFDHHDNVYK